MATVVAIIVMIVTIGLIDAIDQWVYLERIAFPLSIFPVLTLPSGHLICGCHLVTSPTLGTLCIIPFEREVDLVVHTFQHLRHGIGSVRLHGFFLTHIEAIAYQETGIIGAHHGCRVLT